MKSFLEGHALSLGFCAVGVSPPSVDPFYLRALERWLHAGFNAQMAWINRNPEMRIDASSLLAGAKSVICFLHQTPLGPEINPNRARFARGKDYHEAIRSKLEKFVDRALKPNFKDLRTKICVDTSPILEKAFAARAGLGWIGKNTLLVNEKFGSHAVLGEIITNLDLKFDSQQEDKCGDCKACMDACPTNALAAPRELDANRCISYLSIEHKGSVLPEFKSFVGPSTYGCDACMDVCPYQIANSK